MSPQHIPSQLTDQAGNPITLIGHDYTHIPRFVLNRHRWMPWKPKLIQTAEGTRIQKVPIDPYSGQIADYTNASHWGTHIQAFARYHQEHLGGVGFVIMKDDHLTLVDLDHCRDPLTGEIAAWAMDIIQRLDSYTAVSTSGTGIHLLVIGTLPPVGREKGNIQVYDDKRFVALTGHPLEGTPRRIMDRQAELTAWHESVWEPWEAKPSQPVDGEGIQGKGELIPTPVVCSSCSVLQVLASFPSSISLRDRFQGLTGNEGLAYAVAVRDREIQKAVVARLGQDSGLVDQACDRANRLSQRFACPFHEERRQDRPSADLFYYPKTGTVKVRCHHRGKDGMWSRGIGLVDWYAWKETGTYHDLTKAELKLWTVRLFVDMGLIDVPDVERRPLPGDLPGDAPEGLGVVYNGIVERMRVWLVIGGMVPLKHEFLGRWCGMSEHAVSLCMGWLLKHWYLRSVGFLRKDDVLSDTQEHQRNPQCFVMRLDVPNARQPGRGGDGVKRTPKEWAILRQEERDKEVEHQVACTRFELETTDLLKSTILHLGTPAEALAWDEQWLEARRVAGDQRPFVRSPGGLWEVWDEERHRAMRWTWVGPSPSEQRRHEREQRRGRDTLPGASVRDASGG